MLTPDQIDNYALEIISRARSVRQSCTTLLTHNYSSSAPRDLAETIIRVCDYLVDAIVEIHRTTEYDDDSIKYVLQIFQNTDYSIMKIGAHVRYIDGARSERLPWSIISAFQKRIERLLPDVHILLRPQWKYNYSIDLDDLYVVYQKTLSEYQDFVPGKKLDSDVLGKLKSPFYLISFPSMERKNILLHTIIGHEIGHLYAEKYITAEKRTSFSQAVIPEIERFVNEDIKPIPELGPLFENAAKENQRIEYLREVFRCWKRGLEELLADVVGAILFGPAALFSCYESAIQQGIDFEPSADHNYYPPWRMRLRVILRVFDTPGVKLLPIDDTVFGKSKPEKTAIVNQLFAQIRTITSDRDDLNMIEKNKLWALAYKQIEADLTAGISFLLEDLKLRSELVTADKLYSKLSHLIERLENSIPPNAVESDIYNRQPADMVEIINAAWFYKISCTESILKQDRSFNENSYIWRDRLNNLTLKAIEYSDIERDYSDKMVKEDLSKADTPQ